MNTVPIQRLYVWELPVRFYHWINVASVVVLAATGYLIGNPPAIQSCRRGLRRLLVRRSCVSATLWPPSCSSSTSSSVCTGASSETATLRWDNFILVRRAKWREVLAVLKIDVLQVLQQPLDSVGHNALAGATYFFMFLAFCFRRLRGSGCTPP